MVTNPTKQITFQPDGTAQYIGDQTLLAGVVRKRRASFVEPTNWLLRLAFHAVRSLVADDSHLAAWTRAWPCKWRVRVLGGPTFGCYANRAEAIRDEIRWLEENRL